MVVLVLDNGAGSAKVGYSTDAEPRLIPNCVTKAKNVRTRIFIGDQLDDCKDLSGLYYLLPFQKVRLLSTVGDVYRARLPARVNGFLVNWDIERQVWDYMFGKDVFKVNFSETTAVVTEPMFNFSSIQDTLNEVFFEDYQFAGLLRTNAPSLSAHKYQSEAAEKKMCALVVDSGYSFTNIVPFSEGKQLGNAVRRIDVGGKALTNHLKEIVSYRQLMVMDEQYVINQLKEDVCYVSKDFNKDMQTTRNKGKDNHIVRDYVLPDYTHIKRGYVRTVEESSQSEGDEQIIRMNNECFTVPELLFHPSDVGIQQMGIPEAIMDAVEAVPEEMQPHLLNNIVLTGGNCNFPGFEERIYRDVRSLAPVDYDVTVTLPKNPTTYAWHGGVSLSKSPDFSQMVVTRQEYEEHGHTICSEKFEM